MRRWCLSKLQSWDLAVMIQRAASAHCMSESRYDLRTPNEARELVGGESDLISATIVTAWHASCCCLVGAVNEAAYVQSCRLQARERLGRDHNAPLPAALVWASCASLRAEIRSC